MIARNQVGYLCYREFTHLMKDAYLFIFMGDCFEKLFLGLFSVEVFTRTRMDKHLENCLFLVYIVVEVLRIVFLV